MGGGGGGWRNTYWKHILLFAPLEVFIAEELLLAAVWGGITGSGFRCVGCDCGLCDGYGLCGWGQHVHLG